MQIYMPINTGVDDKGHYIRWGTQHKYYYQPTSNRSYILAYNKALKQEKAVYSHGYIGTGKSYDIHSILFPKYYTNKEIDNILNHHNLKWISRRKTKNFKRYRIREPYLFNDFRTKKYGDIEIIFGIY